MQFFKTRQQIKEERAERNLNNTLLCLSVAISFVQLCTAITEGIALIKKASGTGEPETKDDKS